jgi:hypothetical protein
MVNKSPIEIKLANDRGAVFSSRNSEVCCYFCFPDIIVKYN